MVQIIYPVVLVHGYVDIPAFTGLWNEAESILKKNGVKPFTPRIPSHGTIAERTKSLIEQIQREFPKKENGKANYIHVFGHSMGGINARDIAYQAHYRDLGFKVRTVTTFATPHEGVKAICDGRMYTTGLPVPSTIIRKFASIFGGAYDDLSVKNMAEFNKKTPNVDTVKYFSWAGRVDGIPTDCTQLFWNVTRHDGPTDGMVNVSSAIWYGTHLGTFRGYDHTDMTGGKLIELTLPHIDAAEYTDGRTASVLKIDDNVFRDVESRVRNSLKTSAAVLTTPVRIAAEPARIARQAITHPVDLATEVINNPIGFARRFGRGFGF